MKTPVALFMNEGVLESVPSLRQLVFAIAQHGHHVHVVAPCDPRHKSLSLQDANISACPILLRNGPGKWARLKSLIARPYEVRRIPLPPGTICIGVDAEGLIMAEAASRRLRGRLIYCSLEILCLTDHYTLGIRLLKAMERRCHRKAELTIIQDSHRQALLESENRIGAFPTVFLPNSPGGPPCASKSRHLRGRLGIADDRKTVLHAGTIASWSDCERLARSVENWPREWLLLFQCRQRPNDPYGRRVLAMADQRRVWVHSEPLPAEDLGPVVSSADVGVALYSPCKGNAIVGKNVAVMGKASGKIATYLRHGLPVVATELPSLAYLKSNNAGILVSSPSQIGAALATIGQDGSLYSRGATACYLAEFDLDQPTKAILQAIEKPMGQATRSPTTK